MFLNLNELNIKDELFFKDNVYKDERLDKRIYDLKNAEVDGKIYVDSTNEIILDCKFNGTMFIEDSITLEIVPYDFEIHIEEKLDDLIENYQECYKTRQNVLDLIEVLWQNIVLEVPISYTEVKDAVLKGNGWELRNENKKVDEIDPRRKKLEDLLKGDD